MNQIKIVCRAVLCQVCSLIKLCEWWGTFVERAGGVI